ncbi:MAG: hypothetical protein ACPG79_07405 [Poseidonia sp.]
MTRVTAEGCRCNGKMNRLSTPSNGGKAGMAPSEYSPVAVDA